MITRLLAQLPHARISGVKGRKEREAAIHPIARDTACLCGFSAVLSLWRHEGEHHRTEAPCRRCRVARRNCTNYGLALRWMLRRGGDGRTKIVVHHAIDMVRLVWEDLVIIQDHP